MELVDRVVFTFLQGICKVIWRRSQATERLKSGIKTEAFAQRCFVRKGVLRNFSKFTQFTRAGVFFNKTLLKKKLWHRCLPVNFVKFVRTPFLTEHIRGLLSTKNTSEGIKGGENDQLLRVLRLKICDSHLTCKVANKRLNARERVEVVE